MNTRFMHLLTLLIVGGIVILAIALVAVTYLAIKQLTPQLVAPVLAALLTALLALWTFATKDILARLFTKPYLQLKQDFSDFQSATDGHLGNVTIHVSISNPGPEWVFVTGSTIMLLVYR